VLKSVTPSRFGLFLGVMLCQFAVFEAGLRLEGRSEAAPAFQRLFMTDERVGYRLRPGASTRFKTREFETDLVINSSGTRDDEIGSKQPNERRIVVLGDSLVMSIQVPLAVTFCKRLEERLNSDPQARPYHYRVINAGVQGYGPVQEWLFFEHVASAFQPDVVLVALFVGNDAVEAADSASSLGTRQTTGAQVRQDAYAWIRRVVRRSMVLQIMRLRVMALADRLGRTPTLERALTTYLPSAPPDVVRGLEVTRDSVSRIAALAAKDGAKTGVVLLPARFQLDDEDFASLKAAAEQTGQTLVRDAATERFKAALEGLPVPLMDALPALRAAPPRSSIFFKDTIHLTPRGHLVLAEALERFLLDSHLIPTAGQAPVVANR
jgi:hypothetical protein